MGWTKTPSHRWTLIAAALILIAAGAPADTLYLVTAHGPNRVVEIDAKSAKAPLPQPDTVLAAHNMTIHIDYRDGDDVLDNANEPTGATHPEFGFADPDTELREARRARLEETLLYMARVLDV